MQENIIGSWQDEYQLRTVYGAKPLVYADYTASGRSLRFIESYVQGEILPMYANTHTQQSGTGKQTNNAREEARAIVKRVCGANEDDALIFVGNGTTVSRFINLLSIVCCQSACEQAQDQGGVPECQGRRGEQRRGRQLLQAEQVGLVRLHTLQDYHEESRAV